MVAPSFPPYQPLLLEVEGGFDNDPHDNGNWTGGKVGVGRLGGTKYGISTASEPDIDIPNLTVEGAMEIYRKRYCAPLHFDELPAGVDVVTLDPGINNGVWRAAGWLQQAVGAGVDHQVGKETVDKANAAEPTALIKKISSYRLGFDQGLGSLWTRYGNGWTARIAKIEAFSVGLAVKAKGYTPAEVTRRMEAEAKIAVDEAQTNTTKATSATGAGAAGGAVANQTIPDTSGLPPKLVAIVVLIVAGAAVAYYLWHRNVARQRAKAYANAAKG